MPVRHDSRDHALQYELRGRAVQSDGILIERLDVTSKSNAVYQKYRDGYALLAKVVQEFVLQPRTLFSHVSQASY